MWLWGKDEAETSWAQASGFLCAGGGKPAQTSFCLDGLCSCSASVLLHGVAFQAAPALPYLLHIKQSCTGMCSEGPLTTHMPLIIIIPGLGLAWGPGGSPGCVSLPESCLLPGAQASQP